MLKNNRNRNNGITRRTKARSQEEQERTEVSTSFAESKYNISFKSSKESRSNTNQYTADTVKY